MTDAHRFFTDEAVYVLAGPLAQARARRGSEPGWVRLLSREREAAIHEAGHCIAALTVGYLVFRVSIVPDRERLSPGGQYYSDGHCLCAQREDAGPPPPELITDCSRVVKAAWFLTPYDPTRPRWKAVLQTVRMLRREATAIATRILDRHWLLVLSLASELERKKVLDRAAIEPYVAKVRVSAAGA